MGPFLEKTVALLVFGAVIGLALGERDAVPQTRPLNLTEEELQRVRELWAKYGPDYSLYDKTEEPFPCGPLPKSPTVPTSVHRLRPGDVKVVGALGDSLTAGMGINAHFVLGVLIPNRGLSWSGGGQTDYEDQITFPNIVKKYNPDVYGYATGNGIQSSRRSVFNVALSGSTSSGLVDQALELVERMKNDPRVDVANDWKVVTILSGNNDLCACCYRKDKYNVKNFRQNILAALDILHDELPRTLVNLVEPINVEILTELNKGIICSALHLFLCDCAAYPRNQKAERELIAEKDEYQQIVVDIAHSGRYDTRDDFTVVSQPFFNGTYVPRTRDNQPDLSYFAPDCFHFSRRGQAAAATGLWNNMVEPVGSKKTAWKPGQKIECPTEAQPFFYTNKNSHSDSMNHQQFGSGFHQNAGTTRTSDDGGMSQASVVAAVVGGLVLAAVAIIIVIVIRRKHPRLSYSRI